MRMRRRGALKQVIPSGTNGLQLIVIENASTNDHSRSKSTAIGFQPWRHRQVDAVLVVRWKGETEMHWENSSTPPPRGRIIDSGSDRTCGRGPPHAMGSSAIRTPARPRSPHFCQSTSTKKEHVKVTRLQETDQKSSVEDGQRKESREAGKERALINGSVPGEAQFAPRLFCARAPLGFRRRWCPYSLE